MQDLMTVKQAADYMGVSTKTIYRRLEAEKLKASKFGDVWMIAKSDLDALKQQEQEQN